MVPPSWPAFRPETRTGTAIPTLAFPSVHLHAVMAHIFPCASRLGDFPEQRAVALRRDGKIFIRYWVEEHGHNSACHHLSKLRSCLSWPRTSVARRPILVGPQLQLRRRSRILSHSSILRRRERYCSIAVLRWPALSSALPGGQTSGPERRRRQSNRARVS